jgi:predicted transcriptional regulator
MRREALARILFEVASPERLELLDVVLERPRKHAELARLISMSGSETTRHLSRLASAGLVARNLRGQYEPTGLALALRQGLPFFEYLTAHQEYLRRHSVVNIDPSFVARLAELGRGAFIAGAYQVVAAQEAALRSAKSRIWILTEQRFEQAIPILRDNAARGRDVRVLRPRRAMEDEEAGRSPAIARNYPVRTLPETPVFLAVIDDQAGICLPSVDGAVDMTTMILVRDPAGVRWVSELFGRYWSVGQEWPAPLQELVPH